ncbi:MAG: hypothetical protein B1H12_10690 [Desulfobacteraceae bacterium 4484_190.2]|nr:MAG: hypothetical protein B1H12_10690 [Desulfobacteraceae bacterium 4484_190.2]
MSKRITENTRNTGGQKQVSLYRDSILKELYPLSGKEVLDYILEREDSRQFIQELPSDDFFWLIKKVGDDDCMPLLELASEDQWQHVLDLEIWQKDRLHLEQISRWIGKLEYADAGRLVKWFFGEGQAVAYYFLSKSVQVLVKEDDDDILDLPDGFFTLDGVFYVKVIDKKRKEAIENILRTMSREDLDLYNGFLLGLSGVLPSELEEGMYRQRNIRLAEHGFLPFEEALAVYAPLKPEELVSEELEETAGHMIINGEARDLAPVSPLYHAMGQNLWATVSSNITDDLFLDRIRLEFGGLCNQIFSADGFLDNELVALIKTCRKAAGYLNLALEKLCGSDISSAERLVKNNSLISIFRVGFGLALALKWEAEGWVKKSWFHGRGLDFSFWGDEWGATLVGLARNKPQLYAGFKDGEEYRDFQGISELDDCNRLLKRVMALDKLMERLEGLYTLNVKRIKDSQSTFHPLLFNLFARKSLKLKPGFSGISSHQARKLFGHLRAGGSKPPYQMPGFEEAFVKDFLSYVDHLEAGSVAVLKDVLSLIWREFSEEYEWVSQKNLDEKFQRFLWITS